MREHALEGQTLRGGGRLVDYANLVKLPHTIFALPFALVGAVLASYSFPVRALDVALILVAFTSARFAAMGFNRIVDRAIDARNPRTRGREIPSGRLSVTQAGAAVVVACVMFLAASALLNRLCLMLAPLALGWILFYSYTKRFTRWAHLVLGVGLAIAPVGAYLALAGRWSEPPAMLLALAGGVLCWVSGFDVIYSLQDVDFDTREDLHSIPAAFGVPRAIWISRGLHAASALLFVAVGVLTPGLGMWFFTGVGIIAALLVYEHTLVRADDLSRVDAAFFAANGVVSLVFLGVVLVERVLA